MILDSSIIYSNQPGYESVLDYSDRNAGNLMVSLITQLEVPGYHKLVPVDKADFEKFFASIPNRPITTEIISEAIRVRQQRKRSLADSIIAATGLVLRQPVLPNNVADFPDIDGLQLIAMASVL